MSHAAVRCSEPASVRSRSAGSGFTLVELLVVVAIIATLIGLLLPAVQSARESGRRTQCCNNLRQVGLAVVGYEAARKVYPAGRESRTPGGAAEGTPPRIRKAYSWAFRLLPLVEEQPVFDAYVPGRPVYDEANSRAMRTPVASFFCPSRRPPANDRNFDNDDSPPLVLGAAAGGDYAANAGANLRYESPSPQLQFAGPIHTFSRVRAAQVTDGLSKTFAVGEKHLPPLRPAAGDMGHYQQGDTAFFAADTPQAVFRDTFRGLASAADDTSNRKFGSRHPGVTNFVFLDGHVEPLATDIDTDILLWFSAIADGQDPTRPVDGGDAGT